MKLEQNSVSTTKNKTKKRRILNGLPFAFDVEEKMFSMMADIEPDELGEALVRIEDSRTRDRSAGATHALATVAKPRGNGQGRGGGARWDRRGRGISIITISSSGLRSPPYNTSSSGLHSPSRNISSSSRRSISGSHTGISSSSKQQQRPSGHPGGWGPSRVCFRSGQPRHFYAECRAIPPAPLKTWSPAPYTTPQGDPQANYSSISPGDCASSSGGEYRQQIPTPPAPHGPPAPSDSSWSFSTDRAVMTLFCPPGESVSLSGIVSSSSTRIIPTRVTRPSSNNYLHSAFAAQSKGSSSDVWIGEFG